MTGAAPTTLGTLRVSASWGVAWAKTIPSSSTRNSGPRSRIANGFLSLMFTMTFPGNCLWMETTSTLGSPANACLSSPALRKSQFVPRLF